MSLRKRIFEWWRQGSDLVTIVKMDCDNRELQNGDGVLVLELERIWAALTRWAESDRTPSPPARSSLGISAVVQEGGQPTARFLGSNGGDREFAKSLGFDGDSAGHTMQRSRRILLTQTRLQRKPVCVITNYHGNHHQRAHTNRGSDSPLCQVLRSQAGLSAAWGGLCLALLGGFVLCNDLVSYSSDRGLGGSSGFWGSLQEHAAAGWEKQPLLNSIALALPVLWLLGRAWIQRRVYERHGLVIESRTQQDVGAHRFFDIAEIGQAGCFIFGAWIHLAFVGFQAARLPDILLSNAVILLPRFSDGEW